MIIIKVTQEHIDSGERENPWGCPVALASEAAGLECATVDERGITWSASEFLEESRCLPDHVANIVDNYDRNGVMFPFEFAII